MEEQRKGRVREEKKRKTEVDKGGREEGRRTRDRGWKKDEGERREEGQGREDGRRTTEIGGRRDKGEKMEEGRGREEGRGTRERGWKKDDGERRDKGERMEEERGEETRGPLTIYHQMLMFRIVSELVPLICSERTRRVVDK